MGSTRRGINTLFCPYCNNKAEFLSSEEFYGQDYGTNLYVCRPCDSRVGTHGKGRTPLGTMVNHKLRVLRKVCHRRFDKLWKSGKMSRSQAYNLLSQLMDLPLKEAHIGIFNEEQCKRLLFILRKKI